MRRAKEKDGEHYIVHRFVARKYLLMALTINNQIKNRKLNQHEYKITNEQWKIYCSVSLL